MYCLKLHRRKILIIVFCLAVLVFLGTFNQPYYPTTWFDEGLALQGAINLANNGQYAMRSVEGFRILDQPLTANGPGIILPLSVVFKVFGAGLLQARLLMVVYFVLAALLFYKVSSLICGKVPALISTLALLIIPGEGFILFGRQALGNVPALFYFLTGCYFFILLVNRKNSVFAYLTGMFWGITLITKSQYWIVLPVLAVIVLLDLFYYKQIGFKSGLIIIVFTVSVLIFWQFVQYLLIGSENYEQYIESVRSSAKVTVFAFRVMRIPGNIWYLIRSGFPVFVLPGLAIAALDSRHKDKQAIISAFFVLLIVAWSLWYIFASVGWHRYAFEPYVLGIIFFGIPVAGAFRNILGFKGKIGKWTWQVYLAKLAPISFLILSILWGASSGYFQLQRILLKPDTSPQLFAEYIRENVPSSTVIESWEWEIDALTVGWTYHHPTNDWVDRKTAETQFGDISLEKYDPFSSNPAYLIDGPFSDWTGMYKDSIFNGCCMQITKIGEYTLYKVMDRK